MQHGPEDEAATILWSQQRVANRRPLHAKHMTPARALIVCSVTIGSSILTAMFTEAKQLIKTAQQEE